MLSNLNAGKDNIVAGRIDEWANRASFSEMANWEKSANISDNLINDLVKSPTTNNNITSVNTELLKKNLQKIKGFEKSYDSFLKKWKCENGLSL